MKHSVAHFKNCRRHNRLHIGLCVIGKNAQKGKSVTNRQKKKVILRKEGTFYRKSIEYRGFKNKKKEGKQNTSCEGKKKGSDKIKSGFIFSSGIVRKKPQQHYITSHSCQFCKNHRSREQELGKPHFFEFQNMCKKYKFVNVPQ